MPTSLPTPADLHVDQLLTNVSVMYMNDTSNFVADKVAPIVPVRKQSDKYAVYKKGQFFRDVAGIRAPGSVSTGAGYEVDTTNTYFCDNFATHVDVPDELRENADQPFDPDFDAVALVTNRLLLRREVAFATDFFTTGVWGTDKTGVAASPTGNQFVYWSDYANSNPITDIEDARDAAFSSTAVELNKLVLSRQVWSKLKHHTDLIERIKYTQRGVLTVDLVRELLDLRELHIAKAIRITSAPGAAETYAYIFGKHALLYFTPDRPSLRTPSAAYTFHWNRFGNISYVRRIRDEKAMSDMIEGHTFFDQKLISSDCGVFFNGAVA